MKRKLLISALILIMLLSSTLCASAATGGGEMVEPQSTSSVGFQISRTSGTTADAYVTVYFSGIVDEYSVVVYLQKLVNGTWVNDTTNDEYVFYNNGINSSSFVFGHTYDNLVYGTSYRLKVISRDITNSLESRATTYSNLF
ncbi:MAG: hypothetical protein IJB73_00360 [Firmicutes bacterium]|nr:hypothetical protein [Bacillota bacterium]